MPYFTAQRWKRELQWMVTGALDSSITLPAVMSAPPPKEARMA